MKRPFAVAVALLLSCLPAAAQSANPLSTTIKGLFEGSRTNLAEAAEAMPEPEYAFKPTPEVRSFGELVGHVANANFSYCSLAKGEKNPNGVDFEKKTAKAELVKGLQDSFAYCESIYSSATDPWLGETIKTGPAGRQVERARAFGLIFNVSHNNEHYGNIVTYMRLKGHVPPSTQRAQQPRRSSGR